MFEYEIYFSDLNERAQQELLDALGLKDAREANWDMDIFPIATLAMFVDEEE